MQALATLDELISICIPVFNGEATIARAIQSILSQNSVTFEIVVSDNASTDSTLERVQEIAREDSRLRICQNESNIGAFNNYKKVLCMSRGIYLFFLAADDYLETGALAKLVKRLRSSDSVVAVTPSVYFYDNEDAMTESKATKPIFGTKGDRLLRFLEELPNDNSRFYSLYYRTTIMKAFEQVSPCHGVDWAIVGNVLRHGEFELEESAKLYRQVTNNKVYAVSAHEDNKGWVTLGYPMLPFTVQMLKIISPSRIHKIIRELFRINRAMRRQFEILLAIAS